MKLISVKLEQERWWVCSAEPCGDPGIKVSYFCLALQDMGDNILSPSQKIIYKDFFAGKVQLSIVLKLWKCLKEEELCMEVLPQLLLFPSFELGIIFPPCYLFCEQKKVYLRGFFFS